MPFTETSLSNLRCWAGEMKNPHLVISTSRNPEGELAMINDGDPTKPPPAHALSLAAVLQQVEAERRARNLPADTQPHQLTFLPSGNDAPLQLQLSWNTGSLNS